MKSAEVRRVASRRAGKRSAAMHDEKRMNHAGAFGLGMAPVRLRIVDCGLDGLPTPFAVMGTRPVVSWTASE